MELLRLSNFWKEITIASIFPEEHRTLSELKSSCSWELGFTKFVKVSSSGFGNSLHTVAVSGQLTISYTFEVVPFIGDAHRAPFYI